LGIESGYSGDVKSMATLVGLGVAVFGTMILLMVVFEESLIFFPTRYPDGEWDVGAAARGTGCVIEDWWYEAEDGVRLHSWWVQRREGGDDPVVLFFHGNAGNLSHRAELAIELCERVPARVVLAGYRGYGRSEGSPSEDGLYRDARAAWQVLTGKHGVPPERIVIYGKSLGGAVAVDLAAAVGPAGLIVESSFTSVPDMARRHYPFVPRGVIRTRMDSLSKIGAVSCPKLFVHSTADEIVPFELGRKLYEAAPEPKRFFEIAGAGHNETRMVGGEGHLAALAEFINEVAGRK
jgi:fermentation-respiration switch protein FrsA (DUF1100 family)